VNSRAIQNLLGESQSPYSDALNCNKYTTPAFLSGWVAWEALRTRFIRVLMHHKGWKLKDADKALANKKISSMKAAASVITGLEFKEPHHWPNKSAKAWKALVQIEPLRHRIVHGFKTSDPTQIKAATQLVLILVANHEWLSDLPVVDAPNKRDCLAVGSLLTPRRSTPQSQNRSVDELAELVKVDLSQGSPQLPSLKSLNDLILIHGV